MPRPLAGTVGAGLHWAEGRTERTRRILLAEHAYGDRFRGDHPVVPNTPMVPEQVRPTERGRVIYVGRLTRARGGDELVTLGQRLAAQGIVLEVVGNADAEVADALESARERGWIDWRGFLPNTEALARVEGATAGLALLHDEPNYRHSMPTKLLEYLSRGVPFVSTPLPLAVDLAERSGGGVIVPFGDVAAACAAIVALDADGSRRQAMADAGRAWVSTHANWSIDGPAFVHQIEEWSRG
jgi:glycosyltransferase involved in cell wall biosynthesis